MGGGKRITLWWNSNLSDKGRKHWSLKKPNQWNSDIRKIKRSQWPDQNYHLMHTFQKMQTGINQKNSLSVRVRSDGYSLKNRKWKCAVTLAFYTCFYQWNFCALTEQVTRAQLKSRLDYQPLIGKGAPAPPPKTQRSFSCSWFACRMRSPHGIK